MNKSPTFGPLLTIFSFTVAQGLLVHELPETFSGSEMPMGLVLRSRFI